MPANSQYIPLKNEYILHIYTATAVEYILHSPTDIYCISKRSTTAFST